MIELICIIIGGVGIIVVAAFIAQGDPRSHATKPDREADE